MTLMRLLLTLLFASACYGNTCTPYSAPVSGVFPAVVNGIDGVGSYSVRISWTSDAVSGTPATNQRVEYATAAEWAANPGVYPHLYYPAQQTISTNALYQSAMVSNLQAATTYHVAGQSYQGGAWCGVTDETFTTSAAPVGLVIPQKPQKPTTTMPTMSGTHWVYASNCGTSGSTNAKVQDCFTKAQPGDDIGFPAGTYSLLNQIIVPNSPNAVAISCSTSTSICTQSGTAPANGTQVVLSANPNYSPVPINPGVPYYVVSSGSGGAGNFQLSFTSGGSPITLTSTGSSPYYILYSYFNGGQTPIIVHSTASASLLPPAPSAGQDATTRSVGIGGSTIGQYLPNMPVFECSDPNPTGVNNGFASCFTFGALAGAYWFQNIGFSTDPAVYTASVTAAGNDFDPIGFNIVGPETTTSNFNIVFNQCALVPAPPPSRSVYTNLDGVNVSWINSYQSGLDWWQAFPYFTTPVSSTSTSITIPAFQMFWVTSGGTSGVGQRASCSVSAASVSGIGGGATGNFAVWMDHSCALHAQFPTGTTYTTASNISVTTVASPAFPTYTLTTNGHTITGNTVLSVAPLGAITSGAITYFYNNGANYPAKSAQPTYQGGGGWELNGYGPWLFDNDQFQGAEIVGPFITDGFALGGPCYPSGTCPMQQQIGNLTVTRSSLYTHPAYLYPQTIGSLGVWNGGNYNWRNTGESKAGKWTLQDGNIFGPFGDGVGYGQCALHEAFQDGSQIAGYISYLDSSEWTFTNNTCQNMASVGVTVVPFYYQSYGMPYPIKDILIQNNLFLNDNAWNVTGIQPMGWDNNIVNPNDGGCATGFLNYWEGTGESMAWDHNTVYGQGGCQPTFEYIITSLSSNHYLTNNIFNVVGFDPAFGSLTAGSYYNPAGQSSPTLDPCLGLSGSNLFTGSGSCPGITAFHWGGNVMLATWKNSNPSSLTEYGASDVTSLAALYPTANWPSSSTLAARIASVKWFNTAAANLRLQSASPYISGAHVTTDGLDVGANIDQLEQHQGKVSNVRAYGLSSTAATVAFYAPDSFACGVDWTSNSWSTWTRVSGAAGSPNPRVQSVALTGLPAHGLIAARVNCQVVQPVISVQLP